MADKLDWMNKHLALLRYVNLKDVVEKEGYKIRPDLEGLFEGVTGAEEMVFKFADAGDAKSACELLAYIAHRRAAVWWGYRCALSLAEELKISPAAERDIADIGASLEPEVPDWAKAEPPKPDPEELAKMRAELERVKAEQEKLREKVDPRAMKFVEDLMGVVFKAFQDVHGVHPLELLEKLGDRIGESPYQIDPNSPVFTEAVKIKAQIAAVQKETVETIKSVIPPKVPARQKKLRDNALSAVYRWVAAPDAENSQKCMDAGNECPDTPAGLLSLSAFWAYGDLLPLGEQAVPTPPGLAANGLSQTLLLCALHPGGTRKLKERYAEYFKLGIGVFTGADNWEASLASGKMPHLESLLETASASPAQAASVPPAASGNGGVEARGFKRWKPGDKA
jgi:hypothetical protein